MKRSGFKKKPTKPLKRTSLKKKAPKTQAKLKKDLDAIFSKYVRAKYRKECYTCYKKGVTLQCGHFISRQYLMTRWDENNCRPQCVGCNIYGNGKPLDFEERLKDDLGIDFVETMKHSRHYSLKVGRVWYREQIEFYKKLYEEYDP